MTLQHDSSTQHYSRISLLLSVLNSIGLRLYLPVCTHMYNLFNVYRVYIYSCRYYSETNLWSLNSCRKINWPAIATDIARMTVKRRMYICSLSTHWRPTRSSGILLVLCRGDHGSLNKPCASEFLSTGVAGRRRDTFAGRSDSAATLALTDLRARPRHAAPLGITHCCRCCCWCCRPALWAW